jgi:hypothetical protein
MIFVKYKNITVPIQKQQLCFAKYNTQGKQQFFQKYAVENNKNIT